MAIEDHGDLCEQSRFMQWLAVTELILRWLRVRGYHALAAHRRPCQDPRKCFEFSHPNWELTSNDRLDVIDFFSTLCHCCKRLSYLIVWITFFTRSLHVFASTTLSWLCGHGYNCTSLPNLLICSSTSQGVKTLSFYVRNSDSSSSERSR